MTGIGRNSSFLTSSASCSAVKKQIGTHKKSAAPNLFRTLQDATARTTQNQKENKKKNAHSERQTQTRFPHLRGIQLNRNVQGQHASVARAAEVPLRELIWTGWCPNPRDHTATAVAVKCLQMMLATPIRAAAAAVEGKTAVRAPLQH